MSNSIRVLTDSTADLSVETAQRLGIRILPLHFSLEGEDYCDDGTLDRSCFYQRLAQSGEMPQTAAPGVGEILTFYEELVTEGAEDIIAIFLANSLSSTQANAQLAARELGGARVHLLESGQISRGLGFLVQAAAEALARGATVVEVKELVIALRQRTYIIGVLDTLEYLKRSGRVSWVTAQLGQWLKVKPLIAFHAGEARLWGRVRTRRRARAWLLRQVAEAGPLERLVLLHSGLAEESWMALHEAMQPYAPCGQLPVVEVNPIFGTHIGPQGVGVAWVQAEGAGKVW
ncbi:MAG TPA: DegV family protein [Thermoflexia bacterium]|nr:DegV family protein [Thermoflexia bacterium]